MNTDWHSKFDALLQTYHDRLFSSFIELKTEYERTVQPFNMDTARYFGAMFNHHFQGAYQQFIFEMNLPVAAQPTVESTSMSEEPLCQSMTREENSAKRKDVEQPDHRSVKMPKLDTNKPVANVPVNTRVESVQPKRNTDRSLHSLYGYNRYWCVLCNRFELHLVQHFVEKHPENEVFVSRLAPEMATRLRRNDRTPNFCYFCDKHFDTSTDCWRKHILSHTGESEFHCVKCKLPFDPKSPHRDCSAPDVRNIFDMNSSGSNLMGFICETCNYVQVSRHRLVKHLAIEHEFSGDEIDLNIAQVTLRLSDEATMVQINEIESDMSVIAPESLPIQLETSVTDASSKANESNNIPQLEMNVEAMPESTPAIQTNPELNVSTDSDLDASDQDIPHIQFVPESLRFRCGVKVCKFAPFDNERAMFQHLRKEHTHNSTFTCIHCNGVVGTVRLALSHLQLHGDHLYRCSVCPLIHTTEFSIILHVMRQHPTNEFAFKHINRLANDSITKTVFEFRCNACQHQLKHVAELSRHFREQHHSMVIDYVVICASGEAVGVKRLHLQQHLVCNHCKTTYATKKGLLIHHNQTHATNDLAIQISKFMQVEGGQCALFTEQNLRSDRYLVFYCSHCTTAGKYAYNDAESVRSHWKRKHANVPDDDRPFRFEIAELVACFRCKVISTFDGLKNHHQQEHAGKVFVVNDLMNRKKCGLCNFIGNEIVNHFQSEHETIMASDIVNPIRMDPKILNDLLEIRSEKQFKCFHCNRVDETLSKLQTHHFNSHKDLDFLYEECDDTKPTRLITGCCKVELSIGELFNHLKLHKNVIKCAKCDVETWSLRKLAEHDVHDHDIDKDPIFHLGCLIQLFYYQTRVVFGNGLILTKSNLIGTVHDDTKSLNDFVAEFMNQFQT